MLCLGKKRRIWRKEAIGAWGDVQQLQTLPETKDILPWIRLGDLSSVGEEFDKRLIQLGKRLSLMKLGSVINGRLSGDDVMQLGKGNQIGGDFVKIDVERTLEARTARQIQDEIGDDVVHRVKGFGGGLGFISGGVVGR